MPTGFITGCGPLERPQVLHKPGIVQAACSFILNLVLYRFAFVVNAKDVANLQTIRRTAIQHHNLIATQFKNSVDGRYDGTINAISR